jgi:hypothetical protein
MLLGMLSITACKPKTEEPPTEEIMTEEVLPETEAVVDENAETVPAEEVVVP